MQSDAYIVRRMRTAVGKRTHGILRYLRLEEMGAQAINGALAQILELETDCIDEVIVGCAFPETQHEFVLGHLVDQKTSRQTRGSGLTVNQFCASRL